MSTEKEVTGIYAITRKIAAFLKLGEAGKLDSFFARIIKMFEREIKELKMNQTIDIQTLKNRMENLESKLEDAKQELEEVYLHVDLDRLSSNASQDAYAEEYLTNIELKEANVESIERDIKKVISDIEETEADYKKKIQIRRDRIEILSAKS